MTIVTYDAFFPEVLPYVHDCPSMVARNAIMDAAIEFCRKTGVWQVTVPATTLTAAQTSYPVSTWLPANTDFVRTLQAWFGQTVLVPKSIDELNDMYGWFIWNQQLGMPKYATQMDQESITLVPSPDTANAADGQFSAILAVAPTRGTGSGFGVLADVYNRYAEFVAHGARARLYQMAGQPFYDPKLALEYRRKFDINTGEIKILVNKSFTRADTRVRYRRFA